MIDGKPVRTPALIKRAEELTKIRHEGGSAGWRRFWDGQNARHMAADFAEAVVEGEAALTLKQAELDSQVPALMDAVKENLDRALAAESDRVALEKLVDALCDKLAALPGLREEIERVILMAFAMGQPAETPLDALGLGPVHQATSGVMSVVLAAAIPLSVRLQQTTEPRTVATPPGADHQLRSVICAALLRAGGGPLLDITERVAQAVERVAFLRIMEAHHGPLAEEVLRDAAAGAKAQRACREAADALEAMGQGGFARGEARPVIQALREAAGAARPLAPAEVEKALRNAGITTEGEGMSKGPEVSP